MKPQHTPAPWRVDYDPDPFDSAQSILRVIDPRGDDHPQGPLVIANINVAAFAPHMEEPLANAAIIAAAPAAIAALESLAVWTDGEPCFCHVHGDRERARHSPHDKYCDQARAALKLWKPWWPEIEIETTPLFWDCECAEDYIHPASQAVCEHCHAQQEEQPDARVSELPA